MHLNRGLFLRNYLLQSCRNILPDVTVEDYTGAEGGKEDHSGTIEDSIDFVLLNFAEMNKLWVRMQHQGHTRDKDRREKERLELRLLVGTNLVRLSQLETIDVERYKNVVLPGILEQAVSCRDGIAQEYLMECLIQVFPDEFHLTTLTPFLNSCAQLVLTVNVKNIIIALIDRLATSKDIELPDDLFEIFFKQINNIIKSRQDMPLEDIIMMKGSLINFAIKKIPNEEDRDACIDSVFEALLNVIKEKYSGVRIQYRSNNAGKELLKFLKLPIECKASSSMGPIKMSLKLKNFRKLLKEASDSELQLQIAISLLTSALDNNNDETVVEEYRLSLQEIEDFLSELCEPLWKVVKNNEKDELDEDFIDEQTLMARFIHYLPSPFVVPQDDLDLHYSILQSCKRILGQGGPKRILYTFPSIVFECISLTLKYSRKGAGDDPKWEEKCKRIFSVINETITALNDSNCPSLCLKLYLQAALNASKTGTDDSETWAYEFATKALSLYEEEISDSKERLSAFLLIIGTIKDINFKLEDNIKPLRSQCPLFASQFIKKPDQVKAILAASMLFSDDSVNDMVKCIKKCDKITASVSDKELRLQLWVEIFSHLTLMVDLEHPDIESLITRMHDNIKELQKEANMSELIEVQYSNMLKFFTSKKIIPESEQQPQQVAEEEE